MGGGFNSSVSTLASDGNVVYAGGGFTQIVGGGAANRIARWDGTNWAPLGPGVNGRVTAIALHQQSLYIGGEFASSGELGSSTSLPRVARWDGTAWQPLGSGVTGIGSTVRSLTVAGDHLYVGGFFSNAGGKAAGSFAAWNLAATPRPTYDNVVYLPLVRR